MAMEKNVRVAETYEFYAELHGFSKKIYRRFIVKSSDTMETLASILIYIFNADGSHIYEFRVPSSKNVQRQLKKNKSEDIDLKKLKANFPDLIIQIYIDEDMDFMDDLFESNFLHGTTTKRLNALDTKIKDCVSEVGDVMNFTYDFGDSWLFSLKLKNIYRDEDHTLAAPSVIEGKGLGIIEDCGGEDSLADLIEAFKNKSGDKYEKAKEWLGVNDIDFETFDIDECNAYLASDMKYLNDVYKDME